MAVVDGDFLFVLVHGIDSGMAMLEKVVLFFGIFWGVFFHLFYCYCRYYRRGFCCLGMKCIH